MIMNMTSVARGGLMIALMLPLLFILDPRSDRTRIERFDIETDWIEEHALRRWPAVLRPSDDAFGAVDGLITGRPGFQTDSEQDPWWQVDLGRVSNLDRVIVYNDCDVPQRNLRIALLISLDGTNFTECYRHNGTMFRGFDDGKPLRVPLGGHAARYVRITTAAQVRLGLDEVQVYAVGSPTNIALRQPATQSSLGRISQRSPVLLTSGRTNENVRMVVARGLRLAQTFAESGVDVDADADYLRALDARNDAAADGERVRRDFVAARTAVRSLAWKNPVLDFDRILFIKQSSPVFPHMSDQQFGWWSRGGGGIYMPQDFNATNAIARCLTKSMPRGSFNNLDLSFDATKVLFSFCESDPDLATAGKTDKSRLPEDAFYHVFEMNVDGTGIRQITRGRYDDFDPLYLPGGDIAFLSTRRGTTIQCTTESTAATLTRSLPNGYSRCGGSDLRPSGIFTLHAMNADGQNLRALSAFENCEWSPSLASDGRILYSRWDYVDRPNGDFVSLWSANQDGSNPQLVYGNYTKSPQIVLQGRAIPNSSKLVFTASAHHSNRGGSLCLLDPTKGSEFDAPLTRLTPEVCFPEKEGWPEHYFADPWPLSENFFLVSWSSRRLPPAGGALPVPDEVNPANAMGIYLFDAFGNLELLFRDPQLSCAHPIPVRPRTRPPTLAKRSSDIAATAGAFMIQDVRRGLNEAARITHVRVVGVPVKVQPQPNLPMLGVSGEDPGKFVLGTAPVESDGSAHFIVPSGVPLFFQALDENGLAVQTMRTLTQLLPGETFSCIGCHEHRGAAPPAGPRPLASLRPPSTLQNGPAGSWPLRFDTLVQPVLNERCVSCHRKEVPVALSANLDLVGSSSWSNLVSFAGEDLKKLAFERDRSVAGEGVASQSVLWRLLHTPGGHHGVELTAEELSRFATWMDTYAQVAGHFSAAQEQELIAFRTQWYALMERFKAASDAAPQPSKASFADSRAGVGHGVRGYE